MRLSEHNVSVKTSEIDKDKILDWLDQHWKGTRDCPICSNNRWSVSDELVELRPYRGGALVTGGAIYPFIVVTCSTCGHTLLFNGVVAGLLKEQE